jgi:hypothetical protein
MLSGNAERRRRLLDNLQKQIDEVISLSHLYVGFFLYFFFFFCTRPAFFLVSGVAVFELLVYICIASRFYAIAALV